MEGKGLSPFYHSVNRTTSGSHRVRAPVSLTDATGHFSKPCFWISEGSGRRRARGGQQDLRCSGTDWSPVANVGGWQHSHLHASHLRDVNRGRRANESLQLNCRGIKHCLPPLHWIATKILTGWCQLSTDSGGERTCASSLDVSPPKITFVDATILNCALQVPGLDLREDLTATYWWEKSTTRHTLDSRWSTLHPDVQFAASNSFIRQVKKNESSTFYHWFVFRCVLKSSTFSIEIGFWKI